LVCYRAGVAAGQPGDADRRARRVGEAERVVVGDVEVLVGDRVGVGEDGVVVRLRVGELDGVRPLGQYVGRDREGRGHRQCAVARTLAQRRSVQRDVDQVPRRIGPYQQAVQIELEG